MVAIEAASAPIAAAKVRQPLLLLATGALPWRDGIALVNSWTLLPPSMASMSLDSASQGWRLTVLPSINPSSCLRIRDRSRSAARAIISQLSCSPALVRLAEPINAALAAPSAGSAITQALA